MNRYEYSDLYVDMEESFKVVITEAMMNAFAGITGDYNPLHTDRRFAESKGFNDKVVYGMLTASFLSTLAGMYLPGERSIIQNVDISFVKPVFIGDELEIIGRVVELHDCVKQMVLKVVIKNQEDKKVVRGKMKIGIL